MPIVPINPGAITTPVSHFGTSGRDIMHGSNFHLDTFYGSAGADQMYGYGGMDAVNYSASSARVVVNFTTGTGSGGDAAGDTYSSIENATGSAFNDEIHGSSVDNWLNGGAGNDDLFGGGGNDVLKGGEGKDLLYGEAGADRLYGGLGSDTLYADLNDLVIDGGNTDGALDTLSFRYEAQSLTINLTGNGNGTASGGGRSVSFTGIEIVEGSNGSDTINGDGTGNTLHGLGGSDTLRGYGGQDMLFGEEGIDTLYGGAEDDRLDGGAHDDVLFGESGHDELFGGSGADRLNGGRGDDELTGDIPNVEILAGGQGPETPAPGIFFADTFVFDNSEDDNDRDIIWDFAVGVDTIDLSATERFGDEDFDELLDAADQVGNDVVIDTGDGTITLKNIDIDDLSASDFIF